MKDEEYAGKVALTRDSLAREPSIDNFLRALSAISFLTGEDRQHFESELCSTYVWEYECFVDDLAHPRGRESINYMTEVEDYAMRGFRIFFEDEAVWIRYLGHFLEPGSRKICLLFYKIAESDYESCQSILYSHSPATKFRREKDE